MKQLGRLLSIVTWLLVAGSVVIITGGLFGRPLLLAAVPTGSMVPVLNPGDLIVVLPTWVVHSPGLGEIVVYKTEKDQAWIVHRIVDGNVTEGFVTKGDANSIPDPHRVMPRDVAGVVPQVGGKALRMSRLGLLSITSGPLSSPVVAGVALVMGIFLLLLDVNPRNFRRGHKVKTHNPTRARPEAILSMYFGLAGTVFITTLIPGWTLSARQQIAYEVVTQRRSNITVVGQYVLGEVHREEVKITNPSPLPLLVTFNVGDPHVNYEPAWQMIPAKQTVTFQATVNNQQVGKYTAPMQMGVFLPLLPAQALAALAGRSLLLAVVVNAAVPAVLILIISAFDMRSRLALLRFRTRLGL